MKVKNIAFSGIMAAILMGTAGANAAVEIASKQYVISQTSDKATTTALTEGLATKADKEAFEALQDAVNSTESGLATKASTTALESGLALKANAADVYTKEEADGLLATKADVEDVYEKTQTYTRSEVEAKISETLAGIDGGTIELKGYATETYADNAAAGALSSAKTYTGEEIAKLSAEGGVVKANADAISALETKVGNETVANQIATYVTGLDLANTYDAKGAAAGAETAAKSYTDQQVAALSADGGALTTLAATVATKADASTVETLSGKVTANETAIGQNATAISGLSGQISALGDTYATDAEVEGIQTTLQGEIDAKVATSDYNTKVGELETAIAGNKTATETNAAAIDAINEGAVMNSGITSEKVGQYDQAVTDLANKITMPEICMSKNCVLSTLNGEIQWVEITIPVGNEE